MKPISHVVVIALTLVFLSAAAPADVSDFIRDLSGKDEPKQAAAFEQAAQYGPEVVPAVAKLLDSGDPGAIRAAKIALEKIAGAATRDEASRLKLSRALCETVVNMKSREGRDWLLWILSYAGGPEAVHTLVCLLPNPDAFDRAIFALQSIGGEAAARALVCKLRCAAGEQKVAMINALGAIASAKLEMRGTPLTCCGHAARTPVCLASIVAPALLREAQQYDPAPANAAIDALGRIGARGAAPVLWRRLQAHPDDVSALNAYLKIAEKQKPREATAMYLKVLKASKDHNAVTAAIHGLGMSGDARLVRQLVCHLHADRADVYGAAVAALTELHGPGVDTAIQKAAAKADPETKAALLAVLDARKHAGAKPM